MKKTMHEYKQNQKWKSENKKENWKENDKQRSDSFNRKYWIDDCFNHYKFLVELRMDGENTLEIQDLLAGKRYYFELRCRNSIGWSSHERSNYF